MFDRQSKKQVEFVNRDLAEHWRFEVFYYNKKDKSMIVGSRFGAGFAFNYAHRAVQAAMGVFAAAIVALIVLVVVL